MGSVDVDSRPGTFWMHRPIPAQEFDMLAAPLMPQYANSSPEYDKYLR